MQHGNKNKPLVIKKKTKKNLIYLQMIAECLNFNTTTWQKELREVHAIYVHSGYITTQ